MFKRHKSRVVAVVSAVVSACAISMALALPAAADHNGGLVEIHLLNGTTVQVPIAVAANICGLNVEAFTADIMSGDQTADCDADADGKAVLVEGGKGKEGHHYHSGDLVEINLLNGNVIQVPITTAANICNVNVEAFTVDIKSNDQMAKCEADADGKAVLVKKGKDKDKGKGKKD